MSDDPFATVWDEISLARQRRLLQRVAATAEANNIPLYLDWGTLLGHVRERRILPWDDDVDLALRDPGTRRCAQLVAALKGQGLDGWLLRTRNHVWIKICDPSYRVMSDRKWTWPFVDIFIYSEDGRTWPTSSIPRELVFPGRIAMFEGARCWEPEDPPAVLDMLYPGWRHREATSAWDHRAERENARIFARDILTDSRGRKIGVKRKLGLDQELLRDALPLRAALPHNTINPALPKT